VTGPDDLIDRVLDGTASPAEVAELHRRLVDDPGVRRAWWAATALRAQLAGLRAAPSSTPAGRRRWPAVLAAALVLLALGMAALVLARDGSRPAEPARIAGGTVLDGGAGAGPLPTGRRLVVADLVLVLADGSRLTVDGRAELELGRADGAQLVLHAGRIAGRIAPRPPGDPLRIATGEGAITVLGTRFTLDARAGATVLQVAEGAVRISDRGNRQETVRAGGAAYMDAAGLALRTRIIGPSATTPVADLLAGLVAGDALLLTDGDYPSGLDGHPALRVAATGAPAAPVRIAALPGHRPRIVAGGWVGLDVAGRHLRLHGLSVRGAAGGDASGQGSGLRIQDAEDVVVEDADLTDLGGAGLHIERAATVTIRAGRIEGNGGISPFGQGGVTIHAGARGIRMLGTVIAGNRLGPVNRATGTPTGGHGVLIDGVAAPADGNHAVELTGVRIEDNDGPGLSIHDSAGIAVRDARIGGNGRAAGHADRTQLLLVDALGVELRRVRVEAGPGTRLLQRHLRTEVAGGDNAWIGPDIPPGL
jgi:hypothetical protein